jgi:hypothetical protein
MEHQIQETVANDFPMAVGILGYLQNATGQNNQDDNRHPGESGSNKLSDLFTIHQNLSVDDDTFFTGLMVC